MNSTEPRYLTHKPYRRLVRKCRRRGHDWLETTPQFAEAFDLPPGTVVFLCETCFEVRNERPE